MWLNWTVAKTGVRNGKEWHRLYFPRRKPGWVPSPRPWFGEWFVDDANQLFATSHWTPFVRF